MSDVIRDIEKRFDEEITVDGHPRSIGLFPIPEYPEFEVGQGMWSAALEAILTTLRYLAPATLLTLFWGQQSFLFKILKSIDSAFRAIVFSSEEQKKEVLEWLAVAGPVRVEHLDTVWRHGWIICGVLDSALPGACAGHPPNRLSLKHAQAIADHYLGVEPVFSRQELESNDSLSKHQEWKLATYLDRIRQALAKLTPPVSKPASQRTSPETTQFTLDYVARGSGLTAAQVKNKMCFKIYPTSQQSLDPGEITVLIRGPKDTYGMYVIPPILGKAQLIRQKLLGLQEKPHFTEAALPLTQGVTYLRAYGKNNMNKTFHVPKTKYDIEIEVELQAEHAKVSYVAILEGKYQISITSKGQNIVGSPFPMIASRNIISILEKNSFCLEDGEEIDIVDVKSDRKVVLRIVDFVTEKMLLKENGTLEKITDDEAQILMTSDNVPSEFTDLESRTSSLESYPDEYCNQKGDKFNRIAYKVVQMNRVCKIINSLLAEKKRKEKAFVRSRSQQDIPDIVNSTFGDAKNNPFILHERRDKLIIPEHIKVSLKTEKSLFESEDTIENKDNSYLTSTKKYITQDNLGEHGSIQQSQERADNSSSSNNPFLNDLCETNFVMEKDLGSFVKTEYETNKDQIEEAESMPIKILIETTDLTPSLSPSPINPFVEPDIINMERPKTPVLKIITGQVNREGPIYLDPRIDEAPDDIIGNEFINPFFVHHHQDVPENHVPTTDFIIGAPVSLPPKIRASTPEPNMDSIIITDRNKIETNLSKNDKNNHEKTDEVSSVFSTPLHTTIPKVKGIQNIDNINSHTSPTFYSFDSNDTDNIEILSLTNSSDHQDVYDQERDIAPRKDIWDSAYVSIDDNNSSPDSNNNDNNQTFDSSSNQKLNLIDTGCDYANMGPAEKEIWKTCSELEDLRIQEEIKPKLDIKRTTFTPILEESDRSISTGIKEDIKLEVCCNENQSVTFAELKNMYRNLISNNENLSSNEQSKKLDYKPLDMSVDSASRLLDVKRHVNETEGKISEVQANVTESVSVSQTLHGNDQNPEKSKDETRSFDTPNNIVLEKKQYWDRKIREIEAKSMEEDKTQQKRKRLSARHLRHNDSLTKRRGKQIMKNLIKASDQKDFTKVEVNDVEIENRKSPIPSEIIDHTPDDVRLVDKWKKYWDSKLESENDFETTCFRAKSPQSTYNCTTPKQQASGSDDVIEAFNEHLNDSTIPLKVKQELPEEVFKAFETSPKRFFGTSRKQILNKIDNFLGKPSATDELSQDLSGASPEYDAGLVSSRISMFHNISQTGTLPAVPRKYHSMQNIFQRKDSNVSFTRENIDINNIDPSRDNFAKTKNSDKKIVTIDTKEIINNEPDKSTEQINLKNKRARLVKSALNKTFDETVYKQPVQIKTLQDSDIKKSIQQHSVKTEKVQKPYALNKSLVSKSEMDIFTKISKTPVEDDLDKYKSFEELPKINVKNFINLYERVSKTDVRKSSLDKNNKTSRNQSVSSSSTGAVNQIGFTQSNSQRKHSLDTVDSSMALTKSPANRWKREPESMSCGSYEPRSLDSAEIEIISLQESKEKISLQTNPNLVEQVNIATSESKSEITELNKEDESITKEYRNRFKMAKEYFQSLEELRETKKPKRPNECELLLMNKPTESREVIRSQKRVKKGIKSHSVPCSEISKIWQQLQENRNNDSSKLVMVSEKFNVEDLFNDVTEGKLSRQGSLRGIPHKKAVLEAFRSMENLVDSKVSPYEIAISQLSDFAKENSIKNVQTYLSEYPYLPTTDPSKYHSRLDTRATGLISLKELHNQQKPRRNSVPNLKLNPNSTVQL